MNKTTTNSAPAMPNQLPAGTVYHLSGGCLASYPEGVVEYLERGGRPDVAPAALWAGINRGVQRSAGLDPDALHTYGSGVVRARLDAYTDSKGWRRAGTWTRPDFLAFVAAAAARLEVAA